MLFALCCAPLLADESRGYMGFVGTYRLVDTAAELEVTWLHPQGPAHNAGLREGDVIHQVNSVGFAFADEASFRASLGWIQPGTPVVLGVRRAEGAGAGPTEHAIQLVATEAPPEEMERRRANRLNNRPWEIMDRLAKQGDGEFVLSRSTSGELQIEAALLSTVERNDLASFFNRSEFGLVTRLLGSKDWVRFRVTLNDDANARVTTRVDPVEASGLILQTLARLQSYFGG